jgi:hypothetical protein
MSKFKLRVKLSGLEIEVEGDREHAPQIADHIGHQLSQMMQPAALIEAPENHHEGGATVEAQTTPNGSRATRRRRRSGKSGTGVVSEATPITTWDHNTDRFGTPLQEWKSVQKIAWMLLVIERTNGTKADMTVTQIANAFNEKFRSSGMIHRGNVSRDLGNASDQFGEMEGRWFLKEKGREAAEKLILEATGKVAPVAK